jgi:hypothetical protein
MYSIVELDNGNFRGHYKIQDGVEQFVKTTKEEAIKEMVSAAKVMNGVTITEKDIAITNAYGDLIPGRNFDSVMSQVEKEFYRARSLHGSFNSTHEGYAIIKEELDELWDGVKANENYSHLKEEAIQIAAMAIRFCVDL